jgi:putative ATPase
MLEGGEDARFIARRMVDPRLRGRRQRRPAGARRRRRARAGGRARRAAGGQLNLAQAAIYLALAPKSNAATSRSARRAGTSARPATSAAEGAPRRALPGAKKLGHGQGYVYPHDDPAGFDVDHLPTS